MVKYNLIFLLGVLISPLLIHNVFVLISLSQQVREKSDITESEHDGKLQPQQWDDYIHSRIADTTNIH